MRQLFLQLVLNLEDDQDPEISVFSGINTAWDSTNRRICLLLNNVKSGRIRVPPRAILDELVIRGGKREYIIARLGKGDTLEMELGGDIVPLELGDPDEG